MEIQIKQLKINNFKGIRSLDINFDSDTIIKGDNGTGKTTVFDAFCWLLFNKDCKSKEFNIKPINSNGNIIHMLDTVVEAVITADFKNIKLKKIYHEIWSKKRGEAEQTFSGNTTECVWNDEPISATEYKNKISKLIDENIFKLVTNPSYFSEVLTWQERRKILLNVCGSVSVADILKTKTEFKDIEKEVLERGIESYKNVLVSQKREINKEISQIPPRVDEINRQIEPLKNIDFDALEFKKTFIQGGIKKLNEELSEAENLNSSYREKQTIYFNKLNEIEEYERSFNSDYSANLSRINDELPNVKQKIDSCKSKISCHKRDVEIYTEQADRYLIIRNKQRELFDSVRAEIFAKPDVENFACPTCKREMEKNDIDAKIAELKSSFEADKRKRLDEIQTYGKQAHANEEMYRRNLVQINEKLEEYKKALNKFIEDEISLLNELENLKSVERPKIEKSEKYKVLVSEAETFKSELDSFKNNPTTEIQAKLSACYEDLQEVNLKIQSKHSISELENRIKELQDRQKELAQQVATIEKHIYLCEEFTKVEVNLLEKKVADNFELCNFKLFKEQVNGGITDTCELTVNGVPYSDLNTASKINAGLDIINTLSKFYNASAPVFIDNSESVNRLLNVNSQLIKLVVSKDKGLKIENKENLEVV